uniref:SF3 helicase domain-containing protein n=1 Tax=Geoglobus ahangari TaxID=113653 RepID=A0A7C3UEG4_9EURY
MSSEEFLEKFNPLLIPRILKKEEITPILWEKMEWILRFRKRHGLYVFPFIPFGKRPKIEAWNTRNDPVPVDFTDNYGIRCGEKSANGWCLLVFDFEDLREAIEMLGMDIFEKLLKKTLCVRSAHLGFHVYFFCDSVPEKPIRPAIMKDGRALMDLLGANSAVLGPGSLIDHSKCESKRCPWRGQEVLTAYEQISKHSRIAKVKKKTLKKILEKIEAMGYQLNENLLEWLEISKCAKLRLDEKSGNHEEIAVKVGENGEEGKTVTQKNSIKAERLEPKLDKFPKNFDKESKRFELNKEQIERIKSLLKPAYREGFRQFIWLFFSGWAAKKWINPVSTLQVLKALYDETKDDDRLKMRVGALVYSYKKVRFDLDFYASEIEGIVGEKPYGLEKEIREEEIKGITGLREVLTASLNSEDKASNIIHSISEIFDDVSSKENLSLHEEILEYCSNVFESIKKAETQEEIMNLIKKLPDGAGIPRLVDLAYNTGFITDDKNGLRKRGVKSNSGLLIATLPVPQRAYLLWLLLNELQLFRYVKVYHPSGGWECYIAGRHNLLFDAKAIISALAKKLGSYITSREVVNELMEHVASEAKTIHHTQIEPARYLAVSNGILDLYELKMIDVEEELDAFFLTRLPVSVELEFLQKLKAGEIDDTHFAETQIYSAIRRFYDDDNWEKLKLCLGSILTPFPLKLLVIIVGKPDTGKTTLKEALKSCLKNKCATQSLEDLEERFGLAPFLTAVVNITSEKSDTVVRCVEKIKRIVGGDTLSIEEKFKPHKEKDPNVIKMFILVNEIPSFEKVDEAFAERIVKIFADNPLMEEEKDPMVIERLKNDQNCINDTFRFLLYCAWLLKKVNYRIPRDVDKVREILKEANFPLAEWLRESCVFEDRSVVARGEAYNNYVEWAKKSGKSRVLTRRKFYKLMRIKFLEVKRGGKHCFKGVRLKKEIDSNSEV